MAHEVNPERSSIQDAEAMISLSRGGFTPDADGGMSEADVTRTVLYLKRFQKAARITAVLIAMGVGAIATLIYLVVTGAASGSIGNG